jgi:homoserine dehydrogenase
MRLYKLALIGFGNVGRGFVQILRDRGEEIARETGMQALLVAVSDINLGSVYDPDGLSPAVLLDTFEKDGSLTAVPAPRKFWDALRTIRESNADVVVELAWTDLATGEPGISHIRAALESDKHAITTNKGPAALQFRELSALAAEKELTFGVEGTVMSGTPALRIGTELLAAAGIRRIQGILNGTTNFILTQMQEDRDYESALDEAQRLGYAEADPSGDVEGIDAAAKLVILGNLVMGGTLTMKDVMREGITGLTTRDIHDAAGRGECWKLIASLDWRNNKLTAQVAPKRIPMSHPLASVRGATNAVTFSTDLLGDVTIVGPGAGRLETGYAVLSDLLAIHRRTGAGR